MDFFLKYEDFFNVKASTNGFVEVWRKALTVRQGLRVELVRDGVNLTAIRRTGNQHVDRCEPVTLQGEWSVCNLSRAVQEGGLGEALLSPMLFNIKALTLPQAWISTFQLDHRTAAEVLMRNLFNAICRRCKLSFVLAEDANSLETSSQDFLMRYFWVLRAMIDDSAFGLREFIFKLPLCLYLDVIEFKSPLLKAGLGRLRRRVVLEKDSYSLAQSKQRFIEARSRMMVLF